MSDSSFLTWYWDFAGLNKKTGAVKLELLLLQVKYINYSYY